MKKALLSMVGCLIILIAFVLLRFSHIGTTSVPEMVAVANKFFTAVGNNDQGLLDQVTVSPQEVAAKHAGEIAKIHTTIKVKILTVAQSKLDLVLIQNMRLEREAYTNLAPLLSYSYDLDPMGPSLVLSFDCQHAAVNACVTHIYFFFTSERPLKIHSILDFRNTVEWERIWNNQYCKGLVTKRAPAGLFTLPIQKLATTMALPR